MTATPWPVGMSWVMPNPQCKSGKFLCSKSLSQNAWGDSLLLLQAHREKHTLCNSLRKKFPIAFRHCPTQPGLLIDLLITEALSDCHGGRTEVPVTHSRCWINGFATVILESKSHLCCLLAVWRGRQFYFIHPCSPWRLLVLPMCWALSKHSHMLLNDGDMS